MSRRLPIADGMAVFLIKREMRDRPWKRDSMSSSWGEAPVVLQ